MRNLEVAACLVELADLLQLRGEDSFKVAAYRRAARTIQQLPGDVAELASQGQLLELSGIGRALAGKIHEILETGTCRLLEELRAELPPTLRTLLSIPGVGGATAHRIYHELGIETIDGLEAAARGGQLRPLKGFGPAREQAILRGIEALRQSGGRVPLGRVIELAERLREGLARLPGVLAAELAGSVRRRTPLVGDVDLVVATADWAGTRAALAGMAGVRQVEETGEALRLDVGLSVPVEVWPAAPDGLAWRLFWQTGAPSHLAALADRAAAFGYRFAPAGLLGPGGDPVAVGAEAEIYAQLGLDWIPPELREGEGEVEAAAGGLGRLIDLADVRGDLHTHSRWSDGRADIAEMAARAAARGYDYLAVTDHSPSLAIARGLSEERLRAQTAEIESLNRARSSPRILRGIEVDILKDGRLDQTDAALDSLELVVGSIHSAFGLGEAEQTARLVRAIASGRVDVLGHPTGRLLGGRSGYAVQLDEVIETAVRWDVALEINASPERLDLHYRAARRAAERGALLSIGSDAHSPDGLDVIRLGVWQARKAGLDPDRVVNTWPLPRLLGWLESRRRRRSATGG